MKLKAINYWFCSESGVYLENTENQNDFKFIIAEPIDANEGNCDKICIFFNYDLNFNLRKSNKCVFK